MSPVRAYALPMLCAIAALAACKEDGVRPTSIVSVSDTADQVLQQFHHFATADGVRTSEIEADTAFFFNASQMTLLRKMRVGFFDSSGTKQATVVAERGQYFWQNGNMTAEGKVVMTTTDGRVLKSEKLVFDETKQEICSDRAFDFEDHASHVQGLGFCSDKHFSNIHAKQPSGTSKEGMLMPGQDPVPADSGKAR